MRARRGACSHARCIDVRSRSPSPIMLARIARPLALALAAVAPLVACSPSVDPPTSQGSGVVVGLQADDGLGLQRVEVEAKVDGVSVERRTIAVQAGSFPMEIALGGAPGAAVEVTVQAFGVGDTTLPALSRVGRAAIPVDKKLMRMKLDARCMSAPALRGSAPACGDGLTCVAGACAPPDVTLEGYGPGWPDAEPDICRPANAGAPEVILGTGQTDWAPLKDGQLVELEQGPQGGNHVWVSARMKNLKRSGSRTVVTGAVVGGEALPPAAFIFTYDRDEGAYCKIFGLRFQVDAGAGDMREAYKRLLGKEIDVTVEVIDPTGARASSTKRLKIADRRLCADGTYTTCN